MAPTSFSKTDTLRHPSDQAGRQGGQSAAPAVTLEIALWCGLGLFALGLRLVHLGRAPLSPHEAEEALAAWEAVRTGARAASGYTPLLFVVNSALFALFGAGDAVARLGPALCGTVLVLLPLTFRRQLGSVAALIAGAILAFSPSALLASRRVDGTAIAIAGVLGVLAGFLRHRAGGNQRHLLVAAGAAALALSTGGHAVGPFLSLAVAGAATALIWPSVLDGHLVERLRRDLRLALLVLVGVLVVLVSGMGWHPAGLGALGNSLADWPARFRFDGRPVLSPLGLFATYEPIGLLFGVGGIVLAVRRRTRFAVLLGLWTAVQMSILALSPARDPLDALGCVVPLACLAGVAGAAVLEVLAHSEEWPSARLFLAIAVVLWVYTVLTLLRYANTANARDLGLALLSVLMQGVLAALFGLATRPGRGFAAFAAAIGLVLVAATFSAGWGLIFTRATDPREPLLRESTAEEVRDLRDTLREISWAETGLPTTLSLGLEESSSPVLRWYLRDFNAVEPFSTGGASPLPRVLLTARRDLEGSDTGYVGQAFVLARRWDSRAVACTWTWPPHCEALVRWWLLRRTAEPPEVSQWAVVWVQPSDGD